MSYRARQDTRDEHKYRGIFVLVSRVISVLLTESSWIFQSNADCLQHIFTLAELVFVFVHQLAVNCDGYSPSCEAEARGVNVHRCLEFYNSPFILQSKNTSSKGARVSKPSKTDSKIHGIQFRTTKNSGKDTYSAKNKFSVHLITCNRGRDQSTCSKKVMQKMSQNVTDKIIRDYHYLPPLRGIIVLVHTTQMRNIKPQIIILISDK